MANPLYNNALEALQISPERRAYNNFVLQSLIHGSEAFDVTNKDLVNYFKSLDTRPKSTAFLQDNALGMLSSLSWGLGPVGKGAGIALAMGEDAFNTYRDNIWAAYQQASENGRKEPSQKEFNDAYASIKNKEAKMAANALIGGAKDVMLPTSRTVRRAVHFPGSYMRAGRTRYVLRTGFDPYKVPMNEGITNALQFN